jgi:hypothetical protein
MFLEKIICSIGQLVDYSMKSKKKYQKTRWIFIFMCPWFQLFSCYDLRVLAIQKKEQINSIINFQRATLTPITSAATTTPVTKPFQRLRTETFATTSDHSNPHPPMPTHSTALESCFCTRMGMPCRNTRIMYWIWQVNPIIHWHLSCSIGFLHVLDRPSQQTSRRHCSSPRLPIQNNGLLRVL